MQFASRAFISVCAVTETTVSAIAVHSRIGQVRGEPCGSRRKARMLPNAAFSQLNVGPPECDHGVCGNRGVDRIETLPVAGQRVAVKLYACGVIITLAGEVTVTKSDCG